jgi:hypothetical protein
MKLSDYAKQMGVRYETAWRWYWDGTIQGRRIGLRTIISTEDQEVPAAPVPRQRAASEVDQPILQQAPRGVAKPVERRAHQSAPGADHHHAHPTH